MYRLPYKQKSIFFLFVLVGVFLYGESAGALSIFPVRRTVVVDPGKTAVALVEIYNDEGNILEVQPEVDAFVLNSNTGHAEFGQSDEAKSWVRVNEEVFFLKPKEKRSVEFVITVPSGIVPASHYLGLFLRQKPTGGQVGLGKRVGTLLFLHVSGVVTEKMQVQDFSVEKKDDQEFFHIQLLNGGTIHLAPVGYISVRDMWGKQIASLPLNPNQRKVLPGDVWRTQIGIPLMDWKRIGKVHVEMIVNYGLSNQVLKAPLQFWYIPWWFVGGAGGSVFMIFCGIFFVKRYKRV